jgi:hypothetical protein
VSKNCRNFGVIEWVFKKDFVDEVHIFRDNSGIVIKMDFEREDDIAVEGKEFIGHEIIDSIFEEEFV